jgi:DNA modification methylase
MKSPSNVWTSGDVTLYRGDCLEILPTLADGSIDAVVTDPPYGNKTRYSSYTDTRESLISLVKAFMPEALRVAATVVVTPGVKNIYLYPEYSWILSWINMAGIGSGPWGFCCWQPIIVYGKDPYLATGRGRRPDTFIQRLNQVADVNHPCPKPDNVMRWIVERTVKEGATVLDPFMGSGTTGVACVQTGRRFIGIEISEEYFRIAQERIRQAQAQPRIPFDPTYESDGSWRKATQDSLDLRPNPEGGESSYIADQQE